MAASMSFLPTTSVSRSKWVPIVTPPLRDAARALLHFVAQYPDCGCGGEDSGEWPVLHGPSHEFGRHSGRESWRSKTKCAAPDLRRARTRNPDATAFLRPQCTILSQHRKALIQLVFISGRIDNPTMPKLSHSDGFRILAQPPCIHGCRPPLKESVGVNDAPRFAAGKHDADSVLAVVPVFAECRNSPQPWNVNQHSPICLNPQRANKRVNQLPLQGSEFQDQPSSIH